MSGDIAFFARRCDGKFYRVAIIWKWTKSWRRAAVLTAKEWSFLKEIGEIPEQSEILTLTDLQDYYGRW